MNKAENKASPTFPTDFPLRERQVIEEEQQLFDLHSYCIHTLNFSCLKFDSFVTDFLLLFQIEWKKLSHMIKILKNAAF